MFENNNQKLNSLVKMIQSPIKSSPRKKNGAQNRSQRHSESPTRSPGRFSSPTRYPLRKQLIKKLSNYYVLLEELESRGDKGGKRLFPPPQTNPDQSYYAFIKDLKDYDEIINRRAKCEELKA